MCSLNKYAAFEGIDACGKTTQTKLFYEYLMRSGKDVFLTKEPGDTIAGKKIRNIILNDNIDDKAALLLFLADRALTVNKIKDKLKNSYVVSDRSFYSTVAYQSYGSGIDLNLVERFNQFATGGLKPDIVFYIDISVNVMYERLRNFDRIEDKGKEFFNRVRDGYLKMVDQYDNIYKINGMQDKEDVFRDIVEVWNNL